MASLDMGNQTLAGFLAGQEYVNRDVNRRQQAEAAQLQQAAAVMGLQKNIQAQQEEGVIKSILAQSGGDLEKAYQGLVSIGTPNAVGLAGKIKGMMPKTEPQPIGSGGLRLPDGTIVPPAARTGEQKPAEPLHSIVVDGKPRLVRRSEAEGKTPYTPSIAGANLLDPDALRFTAEQYLAGDRQALQGYARNIQARTALQNEIAKQAKAKGWSGTDVAAQMADFAGIMAGSRTVGQRAAQIALSATEAEKMISVAEETSARFSRTNFTPANAAIKAFQENTGSPEVKAFGAALNSLVNVYARAISPSGVPTVSDKDHARELIQSIDSPAQFAAVMNVLRQELKIAKEAPKLVRDATRESVSPKAIPEYADEAAAKAAGIKPGTRVKIGGVLGTWR